ncbi:DNA polymerase III subunit chi [Yoonia sediminilitoris]|uniref:DNA polymerase III chi subunit n=1 Tax=Yoonia sediminilitoris TaxID=1286148 RepID=A0A2T6KCV7_9RHOB|nr:DNA polymerase III subunit chi [Yoonia sediminilitoris]PUB12760.1 DNA polymerase III chi subunit [Yoonia sediminilitoris]RCW94239.1 DNA polymerase III chi subunit [Yoonia sediminilitoris]
MGAAYFYHLTESPLEQTLPMLLGKARQAGWRVLVRGKDAALLQRLDDILWQGPEDGFLPHGQAGGPHDADQPVLLGDVAATGFACVMSVAGADVTPDEVTALERTCILFDGHDGAALQTARGQWKTLTDAGCAAQYWAQEDGRWTKKAEK